MALEFTVDDAQLKRVFKRRVAGMFPAAKDALTVESSTFLKRFKSARMSGRKGTQGLYKRSGKLRDALKAAITGDRLDRLRLRVGWLGGGLTERIARVHEKGKVIKGKPWLVFRLVGPRGGFYGWKKVARVYIPPRLGFRKAARDQEPKTVAAVKAAIKKVVERG
jgi:hypothetical protein